MNDTQPTPNSVSVHESKAVPTEDESLLERDVAYTLLSSRRRRNVLHALYEADGASTVGDLARQLAAWETNKHPATISSKERKRAYTALRQSHIPKLAKHGIVDYDANRGTVVLTERGKEFRPYLWRPIEPDTTLRTGTIAAASGIVVAVLSWLGVSPFAMLGGYQLAGVVSLAFAIVMLAEYIRYRPTRRDRNARENDIGYDPDE
ncbi:hypothetical protein JCM30237_01390 [Halolamina litorea]|uniref:DUF7344 domain-containing protein n=1 Tax=Halolamina litorea TaxID=1515593 RepID=A0ABD6BT83_9EURY|nr:hypothetical protein [Halolamina litorea]